MSTSEILKLRRAWRDATDGDLYVIFDRVENRLVIAFPSNLEPREDGSLPTAILSVFTSYEDACRFRDDLVEMLTCSTGSPTDMRSRLEVNQTTLSNLFDKVADEQNHMNAEQSTAILNVVLAEFGENQEKPAIIDVIFSEVTLPH